MYFCCLLFQQGCCFRNHKCVIVTSPYETLVYSYYLLTIHGSVLNYSGNTEHQLAERGLYRIAADPGGVENCIHCKDWLVARYSRPNHSLESLPIEHSSNLVDMKLSARPFRIHSASRGSRNSWASSQSKM